MKKGSVACIINLALAIGTEFGVEGHLYILCIDALNILCVEVAHWVARINILESEILKGVVVRVAVTVEITVAIEVDISYSDILHERRWHWITVNLIEELGPTLHLHTILRKACCTVDEHILVLLRSVRTHLEQNHMGCAIEIAVLHDYILAVPCLTSKGYAGICLAKRAILNNHPLHRSVAGDGVYISALSALEANGIVVDIHITVADEHI